MKSACLRLCIAVALAVVSVGAAVPTRSAGADWPQWRGPNHTDVTSEPSGWPRGWPPARLWAKNVGKGCTSPIVAGGRLYVMGWQGRGAKGADTIHCLDARTGAEVWKQSYPCRYQSRLKTGDEDAYGGPSSTPTFDPPTGCLYTLSIDGDLRCWNAARGGAPVWGMNLHETYKIRQRPDAGRGARDYGFPGSPLVQGDLLVVEVGSVEGTVMAFDKRTGRRVWRSECTEFAGHSAGPVAMTVEGAPCLATLALRKLVVMRADKGHEGKTVAEFPWATDFANNIPTPAVSGDLVAITSNYNRSKTCLLEIALSGPRQKWIAPHFSKVGSPVIHKGRLYMADGSLKCLDLATGRLLWRGGDFGHGSCLVTGDDKVIAFGNGRLALVEAVPPDNQYHELGRVDNLFQATCYPHVALAGGLIACKDMDGNLVCFSVGPPPAGAETGRRPGAAR